MDLDEILSGTDAAILLLAQGDVATWQTLLEHLHEQAGDADATARAPAAFVAALLRKEPDVMAWRERAAKAVQQMDSGWFMTIRSALRPFDPWLTAGVREQLSDLDVNALVLRLNELRNSCEDDDVSRLQDLTADIEVAFGPVSPLLAEASLRLALRAKEEDDLELALRASHRAEELFRLLGDEKNVEKSVLVRGGVLLLAKRFPEAFEIFDPRLAAPRDLLDLADVMGLYRLLPDRDAVTSALEDAAMIALTASAASPEWVRALGGLAELIGDPDLDLRFQEGLARILREARDPDEALETVIRQAKECGFERTATAAAKALRGR